jgi:hypothetical protein
MTQPNPQVPPELIDQLHQANEHLHESKKEVERAMEDTDYRHAQRVEKAMDGFRESEKHVEEVEKQISDTLHKKE